MNGLHQAAHMYKVPCRASSVKFYLLAKGVNPLRITVAGKGARDFVAKNDSEEGRNLNRRVEIQIDRSR